LINIVLKGGFISPLPAKVEFLSLSYKFYCVMQLEFYLFLKMRESSLSSSSESSLFSFFTCLFFSSSNFLF